MILERLNTMEEFDMMASGQSTAEACFNSRKSDSFIFTVTETERLGIRKLWRKAFAVGKESLRFFRFAVTKITRKYDRCAKYLRDGKTKVGIL